MNPLEEIGLLWGRPIENTLGKMSNPFIVSLHCVLLHYHYLELKLESKEIVVFNTRKGKVAT